jgi:hypothetical protein
MTGTHIIANQDPFACRNDVDKFTDGKAEVEKHWSTSVIVVGMLPGGQAQTVITTTCLIFWETSEEDWRSHLFSQKMKIRGNGISA